MLSLSLHPPLRCSSSCYLLPLHARLHAPLHGTMRTDSQTHPQPQPSTSQAHYIFDQDDPSSVISELISQLFGLNGMTIQFDEVWVPRKASHIVNEILSAVAIDIAESHPVRLSLFKIWVLAAFHAEPLPVGSDALVAEPDVLVLPSGCSRSDDHVSVVGR